MTHEFTDYSLLPLYFLSFVNILQIWVFTTYFYYICFFINIFLIYWMADGIREDCEDGFLLFHIEWCLLLLNLMFQYVNHLIIKNYTDKEDKPILICSPTILQFFYLSCIVLALIYAFLFPTVMYTWIYNN
ncbi:hypothetical protein H8356DRAFT_1353655 [Neocallimastix lanati (nom. inval.)]|nr:hypothetical protein H8356DRAFT_1353655 [Neocallimastix sp. JGI-2020a]